MSMAAMDIAPRIEKMIVEDEGGWVFTDRADDSGGPTYGGMTWVKFNEWLIEGGKEYMRSRFIEDAKLNDRVLQDAIRLCYYDEFWVKGHVAEVPAFAQEMYFSACVNMGVKEALKCLQMAANEFFNPGLSIDGHWGLKTKAALDRITTSSLFSHDNSVGVTDFKLAFSDAIMERYIRIVQKNSREWRDYAKSMGGGYNGPSHLNRPKVLQSENLKGWWNRARSYRSK